MEVAEKVDQQISKLPDWRGEMYVKLRQVINSAEAHLVEEWKWNSLVWSNKSLVCALGAFKNHLKINFFRGSQLSDPKKLINTGFDAKGMRSIDFHEGDEINEEGLKELVRKAAELNN